MSGLHATAGPGRFRILCLLVDLQTQVADACREYITSDGDLTGVHSHLNDVRRTLDQLAPTAGGSQ